MGDPPELSADVFISVFEQQDGCLVDLDGSVLSSRCAGVINVGLIKAHAHTHKQTQIHKKAASQMEDEVIKLSDDWGGRDLTSFPVLMQPLISLMIPRLSILNRIIRVRGSKTCSGYLTSA